jgi:lactate permease
MYEQVLDPVGGSLFATALFAALPLITLFVLLGGLKLKAHWAALASLVIALVVAIAVYSMPGGQALNAAVLGACFGLFPIMFIVWNAIWIYNMTDATGHFAVLRRSFAKISDDQRIQAVIIAFSFGALIEALAGFGAPVAITAAMLLAVGFKPIQAAAVALVANTAPVAFGAIATPIITLSEVTSLPKEDLGAMVGRQTPFLAVIVPLILIGMVDGRRGIRQTWPAAVVGGVAFAVGQFLCSNFLSVEITDIVASLLSAGAIVALLRFWTPGEPMQGEPRFTRPAIAGASTADAVHEQEVRRRSDDSHDSRGDVIKAYAPYIIIVAVLSLAQWGPIKTWLEGFTQEIDWPGLNVVGADGEEPGPAIFKFNWAITPGTLLLVSGLLTMLVLRISPMRALRVYGQTLNQLKWATLTVASVLALAYVMNFSAQTLTLGQWIAGAGGVLAFLSSIIGWLGVAVTGSDTSSNSLFGALQVQAANEAGMNPTLLAAANSSGGVLGKMISPQNLAIGAAAVGLAGQEGELFRKVLGWSLVLLLVMCVLVLLQSLPILSWMVV